VKLRLEERNGDSLDLKIEKVPSLSPGPGNLTGGSFTQRPQRSLRYLLAEATWQINKQNCKLD